MKNYKMLNLKIFILKLFFIFLYSFYFILRLIPIYSFKNRIENLFSKIISGILIKIISSTYLDYKKNNKIPEDIYPLQ